jgi:hypothetical protein
VLSAALKLLALGMPATVTYAAARLVFRSDQAAGALHFLEETL